MDYEKLKAEIRQEVINEIKQSNPVITKEKIMDIKNPIERKRKIAENIDLFNKEG